MGTGGGDDDLAERYRTDMVTFTPGPYDVRVARRGWVYYVRAVRGSERLLGPRVGMEGLVVALGLNLVRNLLDLSLVETAWMAGGVGVLLVGGNGIRWQRYRHRPWRVGVVRGPDPATWNAGPPVLEHEEELARAEDPAPRVASLAEECRAGRFDPPDPSAPTGGAASGG